MITWNDFATVGPMDALPAVDIAEDSPTAALETVAVTIPRSTSHGGNIFVRVQTGQINQPGNPPFARRLHTATLAWK